MSECNVVITDRVRLEGAEGVLRIKAEGCCREWISVEDRLPDDGYDVLILPISSILKPVRYGYLYTSQTGELRWNIVTRSGWRHANFTDITHWQPLPAPPEVE